jgi:hypothetical protein
MIETAVDNRIRHWLLLLSLLSLGATVVELLLQDHTGEPLQLLPFALCAIGIAAIIIMLMRPVQSSLFGLRLAMLIVGGGGVLGAIIHLQRNIAFEQEIRPNAALVDAILNGLKGASPLLAPGTLVFAALVALIATYRHPALGQSDKPLLR